MRKALILGITLLLMCGVASYTYAEVNINPSQKGTEITSGKGSTTLDGSNAKTSVADSAGGNADVSYDAETGKVNVNATSGSSTFTYGIAKLFLDEGDGVQLGAEGEFRTMSIAVTKGEVVATFPDRSKIIMSEGSSVLLVMVADGNYLMNVISGEVLYTDPEGNTRTLTTGSAPVLVQGFGLIPGWRSAESERNPATP